MRFKTKFDSLLSLKNKKIYKILNSGLIYWCEFKNFDESRAKFYLGEKLL